MDGDRDLDALIAGHHNSNLVWFENPLTVSPKPFPGKQSSWKGFDMNEFKLGNRNCRVVQPKRRLRVALGYGGPVFGATNLKRIWLFLKKGGT